MASVYDPADGFIYNSSDLFMMNYTSPIWDRRNVLAATFIGVLAVIGIVGNSLVVYIVLRRRDMHTVTNMYIMNLAKADICFLLVCAIPAASQLANGGVWHFGEFMCRFTVYIQSVAVQAACGTLVIMTLDRYFVISNPLRSRARRTKRSVVTNIGCIWLASFVMHIPIAVYTEVLIDPYYLTPVPTFVYFMYRTD
uniref:G-protein coupled receptor 54-like n=1 Tax=Saccoglossus kowalevskii TaxID=10224 RepID=A0ABM0M8D7_SACKO|nr:PREDICTED: G-protein coupled receptor 54-like [Saccoglossus kowalevskii]